MNFETVLEVREYPFLQDCSSRFMTDLLEHGLNFKTKDVKKAKLNINGGSDSSGHNTCKIPS